jgi:hypothetical protein
VRLAVEFPAMVNARFRKPRRYGFEIVHAARHEFSPRIGINRKFTANPVPGIFRKFSRD